MTYPAKYVYAITDQGEAHTYGKIGLEGAQVYAISEGPLAAIVSDVTDKRVRPERAKLAAHHAVIAKLMEEGTVLPMAFGTIASSPKALQKVLRTNKDSFQAHLQHVKGKVEMGLRVAWDVPNVFEYFVSRHADLMSLRDDLYLRRRQPSRDEKIALGRLFDQLLLDERQAHTDAVIKVLSPHCVEIKENKLREEREVMRLACLIDRDAQKRFEDGVFEAAHLFDDSFAFDFNGPWSPYNFVDGSDLSEGAD
ncbi:MAG: GvpL/GvpF family gas vesicle protein [Burkholderiales bacterium]|nr:GvpL/GvpF family gas vesicle protein [Burkholderiales bacterium]